MKGSHTRPTDAHAHNSDGAQGDAEREAAIRIQAAARGHLVRKSLRFSQPDKPHDHAVQGASPATRDFDCSHALTSISENEAAIRIQAAARGHLVRKSLRFSQPGKPHDHALKCASPATQDFACSHALASISENEAAIRIQAAARGHLVRKSLRFSQPGEPHDHAPKCASPATRDFACSHALASTSENEAAIRIQAAARGHLVRKNLRVSQPDYHALKGASPATRDFACSHALASISENQAAIRIQAAARGHLVRKSLHFSQPGKPRNHALQGATHAT
jgi:hypothetical protein